MLLVALGLLAAASPARGQQFEFKREVLGLQGTWDVVKFERDEKVFDASGMTWTIGSEAIVVKIPNDIGGLAAQAKTPYRLNITNKLHGIDLMPTYPPNQGKTVLGIYSLEEDTLKLCLQRRAGPTRPTEFTSAPGSNCEVLVLKRKK
jgi:uncharacterized protein (TIGR03067 family)